MMHLEIVMIGEPAGNEFYDLRKTGRGLGVTVSNVHWTPSDFEGGYPFWALETWRGPKAHSLEGFQFPERITLITGTTNHGLDPEWRDVIDGSIYIDQGNPFQTYLSVPAAGAMVMWEFHKQRSR